MTSKFVSPVAFLNPRRGLPFLKVENPRLGHDTDGMPMTVDQIVKEAIHLPPTQVAELVDRLTLSLHHAIDPEIDEAWKKETRRRIADLEDGRVQPIPGEEVSARVRRLVGR